MRASLGWSYAAAGSMNAANAAGYLLGALGAAYAIARWGAFRAVVLGSLACVLALALSALTGSFALLDLARILAGVGAAVAFVAGGALAAAISQRHPERASFLLGLFYVGPGIGILLSGIGTPLLLDRLGPGSWRVAWGTLVALAGALAAALPLARHEAAGAVLAGVGPRPRLASMGWLLLGCFAFGAGYIAYMTFMLAWTRDAGGGPTLQAGFWSLIGLAAIASPWLWSGLIGSLRGGSAIAALIGVTLAGAILPLLFDAPALLFVSALVFGSAFFAVVAATTAFVRRNLPRGSWSAGIGALAVAFGLGQTLGPVATGWATDLVGGLSLGLWMSAGFLALGAILAAVQRDGPVPEP
jgi:MFS family permease